MNTTTEAPCTLCDDLGTIPGGKYMPENCSCPKGRARRQREVAFTNVLATARLAEQGGKESPRLPSLDVQIQDMALMIERLTVALTHAAPGHPLLGAAERMLKRHGLHSVVFAPASAKVRANDLLGVIPSMDRIDVEKWMRDAICTGTGITRFSAGEDGIEVEHVAVDSVLRPSAPPYAKMWPVPTGDFTTERRNDPHNPGNRHNPLNMGRRRSDQKE